MGVPTFYICPHGVYLPPLPQLGCVTAHTGLPRGTTQHVLPSKPLADFHSPALGVYVQAFCTITMQSASSAEGQARLALLAAVTLPHAAVALAQGRLEEARLVLEQGGVLPVGCCIQLSS
jgi:hypothetical protein